MGNIHQFPIMRGMGCRPSHKNLIESCEGAAEGWAARGGGGSHNADNLTAPIDIEKIKLEHIRGTRARLIVASAVVMPSP